MKTITKDKVLAFRVPSIVYEQAEKMAEKKGVKTQILLMNIILEGLHIKYIPESYEVREEC